MSEHPSFDDDYHGPYDYRAVRYCILLCVLFWIGVAAAVR